MKKNAGHQLVFALFYTEQTPFYDVFSMKILIKMLLLEYYYE